MKKSQVYISKTFPNILSADGEEAGVISVAHKLYKHFESPDKIGFDMQQVWQLNDVTWSDFFLKAFKIFYEEDVYRPSKESVTYLNANDVAQRLGLTKQALNYRIKSGAKLPKPSIAVSGKPAWDQKDVEKFLQNEGSWDQNGNYMYPMKDE